MLLNIYLGSLAISWVTILLGSKAIENRLKREGYIVVKKKKTLIEKIFNEIQTIIKGSIPVFNLIVAGMMIFMTDKFYEELKQSSIEKGDIVYKPMSETKEEQQEDSNNVRRSSAEEPTKHMTAEEKLVSIQQEKEKLELYLANKEKIDAYYAYMKEFVQVQVENQILNQMPPFNIDNLSLEELKSLLIQVQSIQPKEDGKSPKTKF